MAQAARDRRRRRRTTAVVGAVGRGDAPVRLVGVGALLLGVVGAALATRSWYVDEPRAFVTWSVVALLAGALGALLVLPGRLRWRGLAVALAVVLVGGVLGWRGVAAPRADVAAAYDGDGVAWAQAVPEAWSEGEDADDPVGITVVTPDRVVLTHGDEVLVMDPVSGEVVAGPVTAAVTSSYGVAVARTVDGFALQDRDRFAFFDPDGTSLGEPVSGDELVARVPGATVVLECTSGCAAVAYDDAGEVVWSEEGYERLGALPAVDEMPPIGYDTLVVVPAHAVLARDRDTDRDTDTDAAATPAGLRRFDERDPLTGGVVRSFTASDAGSTLDLEGTAQTFAVTPVDPADPRDCVVTAWVDDEQVDSPAETCGPTLASTGQRLLLGNGLGAAAHDLEEVADGPAQLTPGVDTGTDGQPFVVHDSGPGGFALRGIAVRTDPVVGTERDPRAVSGGTWGTPWGERWVLRTSGDVTNAWVGPESVAVSSDVAPRNPWDRPAEEERQVTAVDLGDGEVTGTVRVRDQLDSVVALPDGAVLLVVDHRILRLGGDD